MDTSTRLLRDRTATSTATLAASPTCPTQLASASLRQGNANDRQHPGSQRESRRLSCRSSGCNLGGSSATMPGTVDEAPQLRKLVVFLRVPHDVFTGAE